MPAPTYKTRGDLRDTLLDRLGFGGLGAAAGNFVPMANDLLTEGQEQMMELIDNRHRRGYFEITTAVGQEWYDIPNTLDTEKVESFEVQINGYWYPVKYGITKEHDNVKDTRNYPYRYQLEYNPVTAKTQYRISPEPDAIYTMRVLSELVPGDFTADGHYCSIDYRLILLYAIAYGKSHLGRADKQDAMDALNFRIKKLKSNQHQGKRYIRGKSPRQAMAKPTVVE